jgi:drug/metabolite transporter (DMT)-like permease
VNKNIFSLICAILTSILWGSAFVAQDMGMDFIGPHTFNVGRFLVGFLTLLPFFLLFDLKKIRKKNIDSKKVFYYLILLGFILGVGQALQQISLIYTDVANILFFQKKFIGLFGLLLFFV